MGFDLVSKLLFPSISSSYGVDSFPGELIWVPKSLNPQTAEPDECIPCLFLPYPTARFVILYLHSNAEDIGRCHGFCASMREQFQVHVLAVEYPGYGICPGTGCDEKVATENAQVGIRFLMEVLERPLDSILLLGRSIGCGPAISLALQYHVAGVILISPMTSLKDLCRDTVGPLANLVEERFPNKDRMALVRSPVLVVHGQKDSIIPYRHGLELYQACKMRKLLVCPKDMDHNTNLLTNVAYLVLPMLQFFSLPDYCFEDVEVPSWAIDKRLSTHFSEADSKDTDMYCASACGTLVTMQTPRDPRDDALGCFRSASKDKDSWGLEMGIAVCMRNMRGAYGKDISPRPVVDTRSKATSDIRPNQVVPLTNATNALSQSADHPHATKPIWPTRVSPQPPQPHAGADDISLLQRTGRQPEDTQERTASRSRLLEVSDHTAWRSYQAIRGTL